MKYKIGDEITFFKNERNQIVDGTIVGIKKGLFSTKYQIEHGFTLHSGDWSKPLISYQKISVVKEKNILRLNK